MPPKLSWKSVPKVEDYVLRLTQTANFRRYHPLRLAYVAGSLDDPSISFESEPLWFPVGPCHAEIELHGNAILETEIGKTTYTGETIRLTLVLK